MENRVFIDPNNKSIMRIEERCVNCGQCLNTCKNLNNLDDDCINCGQCILTCPMGAIVPKYTYQDVQKYLLNSDYTVIVSTSPAVRVAIGDEFGYEPGEFLEREMVGVLKDLGFDYVLDTTFGADLTIMEEASELKRRIENQKDLPMMTSCCSSWVTYMEKYHGNDLNLLSSSKSPISMQGAIIKNYFASKMNLNKEKIINVALTPCVSKKSEIARPELEGMDFCITTSELAMMIREAGIDFKAVIPTDFDSLLGKGSGAGVIFGASGGVMESALRTAYYLLNNEPAPIDFLNFTVVRGEVPIKEAFVDLKVTKIKVAVINGIKNIEMIYPRLRDYTFIEVMSCPGGCIGGAGQPMMSISKLQTYRDKRMKNLYADDANLKVRNSYDNPDIKEVYRKYLGQPLSEVSEDILHTKYEEKIKTSV
ncbi:MAG: iron hydrogenase small subunit [Bacilli bacterium]|nr:iron hydrogenase small subunit [Bacilli bacterium]